ncbi:MAG: hypothetical protein ACW99U_19860 [Candidatus Thorarchaeota archaeon]|jgi:hypothetical protein
MPATKTRRRKPPPKKRTATLLGEPIAYAWAEGAPMKVPASVVGRELAKMNKEEGEVVPKRFWKRFRSKNSSLHSAFEWNDRICGDKYRTLQAAEMVRFIRVIPMYDNNEPKRAYIHVKVKGKREGVYRTREDVMSSKDLLQSAIRECTSLLYGIKVRFAELKGLEPLFSAIDEAYDKYHR